MNVYKKKIMEGANTIENERQIREILRYYKDTQNKLSEAYSERNAPSGYPLKELNKRQNEIQQFGFNHERMQKEFNENEHEKYKFKGAVIEEDYMQKEEYRDLGNQEVIKMGNNKIKEQDEKIGYITLDVKKDTQLAKHTKHVLKEQNKKIEQINEDIDRTHEKMENLTDRFKKYASGMGWCRLIVIIVIEIGIALAGYLLLFD